MAAAARPLADAGGLPEKAISLWEIRKSWVPERVCTDAAQWSVASGRHRVRLPDGFRRNCASAIQDIDGPFVEELKEKLKSMIWEMQVHAVVVSRQQRGQLLATDRDEGASRPGVEKLHGHRLGSELKVNPTTKGRRQGEKRFRGDEPSSSCSIDAIVLISESDATCALPKRHMEKGKRWMAFRPRPRLKKTHSCHMEAKEKRTSHHMNHRS